MNGLARLNICAQASARAYACLLRKLTLSDVILCVSQVARARSLSCLVVCFMCARFGSVLFCLVYLFNCLCILVVGLLPF